MSQSGVLVIVQTFPPTYRTRPKVLPVRMKDVRISYARRDAPWYIQYPRVAGGPRPPYTAQLLQTELEQYHPSDQIQLSYSNLLHSTRGNFRTFWDCVLQKRSERNYIVLAGMLDMVQHVAVLSELLCGVDSSILAMQPQVAYDGDAIIFTDFTIEQFRVNPQKNPFHTIPLLAQ